MNILRRLYKATSIHDQRQNAGEEVPHPQQVPSALKMNAQPSLHDLHIGLASDPGRIRDHNEDTSLAWQFLLARPGNPPVPIGLFVVADGMGGHAQGEQASALAVSVAASHVIRQVSLPLLDYDESVTVRTPINEILSTSVQMAHETVAHRLPEAGTTITMALLLGDGVYIAHVGDSRAYLGQRGKLQLLTRDHSVAARLLEMGQTTPEEAAAQRNILYKALGQGAQVEPDIIYHDLEPGQYLLLCCDGLWGKVPDHESVSIIEASPTPDIACRNLVSRANENGGEDNISVILAARGWPLPAREQPRRDALDACEPPSNDGV